MDVPETRYALSGDLHIAYQTFGDGPLDVAMIPGFAWHVEEQWAIPEFASALRRFTSFARVISFDKRGTGLSDRVGAHELPTLEERMDDLRAVLDAVGSERPALLGFWEGGAMAALFAATHPDRTRALVLYAPPLSFGRLDGRAGGDAAEAAAVGIAALGERWGRETILDRLAPSVADDPRIRRLYARLERYSASPGAVMALARMNLEIDVRDVLPAIRVPTLVLRRRDDALVPRESSHTAAESIPGARFVELAGRDHLPWFGDAEAVVGEIEEFLTGDRTVPDADRVLATILFTDVVASTAHAQRLGDRRWSEALGEFQALVRGGVERFRGRLADFAGDGALATFDGPARAIRAARAIHEAVSKLGLELRSGLHSGECERRGDAVSGIAVHIGARVVAEASAGEILVSRTVRDLVAGSGIAFESRGRRTLKGVPGDWELFAVRA